MGAHHAMTMHRLRSLIASAFLLLILLAPQVAQAVRNPNCFTDTTKSFGALISFPLFEDPKCQSYDVVLDVVIEVVNVLIRFVLAIAFIFLLITGYQFITSVGDKAGMENAKRSLLYIVIGILAVLGSFMLVKYISIQFLSGKYQISSNTNVSSSTGAADVTSAAPVRQPAEGIQFL